MCRRRCTGLSSNWRDPAGAIAGLPPEAVSGAPIPVGSRMDESAASTETPGSAAAAPRGKRVVVSRAVREPSRLDGSWASAGPAAVVIPAHNEERQIARCLAALTEGTPPGELEILVVCNGCTDRTAEIARSFGPSVRVLETPIASKSLALQLGDQAAKGFPRFYVDADVLLSFESVQRVAEALREGRALAAAPRLRVDLTGRSWLVRAYYEIWLALPYHTESMIGSGVYCLSKEGRTRFHEFPDLISDDGFVRLQFAPGERITVQSAEFVIKPPETLRGIISVKTRSQKGAIQLRRAFPQLLANDPRSYSAPLWAILKRPRQWPKVLVYGLVITITKARGYWVNWTGNLGAWERDESSRASPPSP